MEVRNRIIAEAGHLFGMYGIKSMTMDSLAEEMGVSKRTIYEHFRDKNTLLHEVLVHFKKEQSREAHRIIGEADNAIEAMFRIVKQTIQLMKRVNPLFFHDFRKYHSSLYRDLSELEDLRDHSVTRNLLETGVRQEVFRNDIHIDIVNSALHELFNLFGPESSLTRRDYHRKELFDHIIIPYFRGISTVKGQRLLEECKHILD